MTFYHFTDPRNIPSIQQNGLLSWSKLLERNIDHIPASNDISRDLDKNRNLENYVRVCCVKKHPMAEAAVYYGRIRQYCWLEIDDAILDLQGTLFSNDNATANRSFQILIKDLQELWSKEIITKNDLMEFANDQLFKVNTESGLILLSKVNLVIQNSQLDNYKDEFNKLLISEQMELLIKENIPVNYIKF